MPTKQETFDKVVRALRKQGSKAMNSQRQCVYRTTDGCKCAAGHLIPDDRYEPSMEGLGVCDFEKGGSDPTPLELLLKELGYDLDLVADLQACHDMSSSVSFLPEFTGKARSLALDNDLDPAVCDEVIL